MIHIKGERRPIAPRKKTTGTKSKMAIALSVCAHLLVIIIVSLSFTGGTSNHVDHAEEIKEPLSQPEKPKIVQAVFISPDVIKRQRQIKAEKLAIQQQKAREAQETFRTQQEAEEQTRLLEIKKLEEAKINRQQEIAKQKIAKQRENEMRAKKAILKAKEKQRQQEEALAKKKRAQEIANELAKKWALQNQDQQEITLEYLDEQKRHYQSLVTKVIVGLIEPMGMKDKQCQLSVSINPNGLVSGIDVYQGDKSLCIETRRAILRADRLPVSKNPKVYAVMSSLDVTIRI